MPEPFPVTEGELGAHWNRLQADVLVSFNPAIADLTLRSEVIGTQLVAGFVSSSAGRAERLRGGSTAVVRFTPLSGGWKAWLGYREVWSYLDGPANRRRYHFSSSDLTVFFEAADSGSFQQALRAEWAGVHKEGKDTWTFRPANAGHPHWQVDVAELIRQDNELKAARALLVESAPQEFGEDAVEREDPCWYNLGRMHLASGMRPWTDLNIAHLPSRLAEVRDWTITTLKLLRDELERL